MEKQLKRIIVTGVVTLFVFNFIACDSSTSEHATSEEHTGHTDTVETEADVPNYQTVTGEVKDQIEKTYKSYITLKNALVAANPDDAKKAALSLKANAEKVSSVPVEGDAETFISEQVSVINQHAEEVAGSGDIEAQRAQLHVLSSSLYSLIKATGANPEIAYYQYCPMANNEKGAYWISESKEIRNPYFGDKMSTCGENKETLPVQ